MLKLSHCSQSSVGWKGVCGRAIDGNTNRNYWGHSCTHTKLEHGWWVAKTQKLAHIRQIKIYNRADCCANRLTNFVVMVDGHQCASYHSRSAFSVKTFHCNRVGRSVMIRSRARTYLTLCEVQVFGAYTTRRSGPDSGKEALPDRSRIKEVVIYNRLDCCSNRLNNFDIIVDGQVCARHRSSTFFSVKRFKCDKVGQNVIIRTNLKKWLTLCEVEVFGEYIKQKKRADMLPLSHCSQSSVGWSGVCSRAIDGNTNQYYWGYSCTHTKLQKGWWMAKTQKLAHIKEIKIFNRLDCCSNRLTNFVVTVDGHACVSYNSRSVFRVKTFRCNRVGRIVKISSRKRTYLTLCEVQVFGSYTKRSTGNKLSFNKCFQTSTGWNGVCKRAMDGNKSQSYWKHSCSHTKSPSGFWQGSFTRPARIKEVVIYNRLDCCSNRLNNFDIIVDGQVCARHRSSTFFSVKRFKCDKVGQNVIIRTNLKKWLTLCEVEVFGEYIKQKKRADMLPLSHCSQSSVGWSGVCSRAIDGNTNQYYWGYSCTHTKLQKGWWMAKTQKLAHIKEIKIFNRLDCCSNRLTNFVVTVDGHACASYNSRSVFKVKTFRCNRVGRIVKIFSRKRTYLTLCEVQVFGTYTKRSTGKLFGNIIDQENESNALTCSVVFVGKDGDSFGSLEKPNESCDILGPASVVPGRVEPEESGSADSILHLWRFHLLDGGAGPQSSSFWLALSSLTRGTSPLEARDQVAVAAWPAEPEPQLRPLGPSLRHAEDDKGPGRALVDRVVVHKTTGVEIRLPLDPNPMADGLFGRSLSRVKALVDGTPRDVELLRRQIAVPAEDPQGRSQHLNLVKFHHLGCCCITMDVNSREGQRAAIFTLWKLGKKRSEIYADLCNIHGANAVSRMTVYNWVEQFEAGRTNVADLPRSGRPCTSGSDALTDRILDLLDEDCRLTIRQIADRLDTPSTTVHRCLSRMDFVKLTARWVPRLLTSDLRLQRQQICQANIRMMEEYDKLSFNKCFQTSTGWNGVCKRAMDGNKSQDYKKHSCSHTKSPSGFWQGSFTRPARIKEVVIYNRLDCCSNRLNNFDIIVDGQVCARHRSSTFFSVKRFKCDKVGQNVIIRTNLKKWLTLCEVEVFGEYIKQKKRADMLPLSHCSQSSVGWSGVCSRAIDGNTNQYYWGYSCTHTKLQKGWWMAKTQKLAHIKEIKIFNRLDCCSNRLTNFVVTVDGHACVSYNSRSVFRVKTFRCNRVGRIVKISSRKRTYLTLCEVQVFGSYTKRSTGNKLSFNKCFQTSTGWNGVCKRAMDGNKSQDYKKHSCSHTKSPSGFWQGSFTRPARIKEVVIYNRLDCCSNRLNNFDIIVDGQVCARHRSSTFFSVKRFKCDKVGQNVIIRTNLKKWLTLCEVEVFGEYIKQKKRADMLPLSHCSQSSVGWSGVCSRAIDGNTNQYYWGYSCTHTKLQKGWWMAKTQKLAHIKEIKIFNRLDCCSNRLTNFVVTVDGHACASYNSRSVFKVKTFRCNRVGRIVKIFSRKRTYLTLCEVQVFGSYTKRSTGNKLSFNKCFQTSTGWNGVCKRAMDGNKSQDYKKHSCSHTKSPSGFWQGSFTRPARIKEVVIYNRLDCCSNRLNNFDIIVDGQVCARHRSSTFFSVKRFKCDKVGQNVIIRTNLKKWLTLCEVEVFGEYIKQKKRADMLPLSHCSQSSVGWSGVCSRAIDGNTNQYYWGYSCTHTKLQKGWWMAKTQKLAHIKEIKIFNRLDCCSNRLTNFVVTVDGHACASYNSRSVFRVKTFRCNRVGRTVMIRSRKRTYLTLCEVQVFGSYTKRSTGNLLKLGSCRQSSTAIPSTGCAKAIDGNTNQSAPKGKSCSHNKLENNGWWIARTQKLARIREIKIFNRADCCANRLTDFVVTVDGNVCGSYKSADVFMVKSFRCNLVGREVMIMSRKRTYLTLCEVQVFGQYTTRRSGNKLSFNKCFQTSTGWNGVCKRAMDGNKSQDYKKHSCSHTKSPSGFWQGSFTRPARIKEVVIYNRLDCCSNRLNNFDIIVDGQVCARHRSSTFFSVKRFKCDKVGQNVIIRTNLKKWLTLCEVEVFGEYIKQKKRADMLPLSHCSQSSVGWSGVCSRAIDGNTNQYYWGYSCTHTKLQKGWWMAKTQKLAHIKEIKIFNRLDCCSNRLTNFVVTVDGHACASYNSRSVFKVKTFRCNRVGRIVKIFSRKRTYLTLCEVQVFGSYTKRSTGNKLSFNKCFQTSTGWNGVCKRAMDGNKSQDYKKHSCSHTKSPSGFWQGSFTRPARIKEVVIYNRLDCCSNRLNNFDIIVDGQVCARHRSSTFFSVKRFKCDKVGQNVIIRTNLKKWLTLCEVEVFGEYIKQKKRADMLPLSHCSQSSVGWSGVCSRAIDGNTNQYYWGYSCTHTKLQKGWWMAKTQKLAHIKEIKIFNRLDCCSNRLTNFVVTVDGHACASYNSRSVFRVKTFRCNRVGRTVMIRSRKRTYLTLCEVQVFGSYTKRSTGTIDGNTNQHYWGHSCTHTKLQKGWWTAKTQKLAHIKEIKIFNRVDCCSNRLTNFVVTVDGHVCASYNSRSVFKVKTFKCNKVGRVVMIRSRKRTYLTLCEVQVFGKYFKRRPKFEYLGCFYDSEEYPDFFIKAASNSKMTQRKCNRFCKSRGTTYFAVQSGNRCFCGENYGNNGEAEDGDCNVPCSGDSGMKCGGKMRNAVFELSFNTCFQTSTGWNGVCKRAMDGNKNQDYGKHSCTHTKAPGGFWQGSFTRPAHIKEVVIYNRLDCCSNLLNNFDIIVDGQVCARHRSSTFFSVKRFKCDKVGQNVIIRTNLKKYLTLCEVEVFGEYTKLAAKRSDMLPLSHCSQSSVGWSGVCSRAIDGNTNQNYWGHSCTHTKLESGWWMAKTQKLAHIKEIKIFNRLDCCFDRLTNFVVTVDGHVCGSYHSHSVFKVTTFRCNRVGRVVMIRSRKRTYLTLCEVQVFGSYTKRSTG
uniref:WSC domain-containing protein n=1 Tax=Macrostomum lignano TaxID=282301 RepID=A0A1I8GCU5_9PLAT